VYTVDVTEAKIGILRDQHATEGNIYLLKHYNCVVKHAPHRVVWTSAELK